MKTIKANFKLITKTLSILALLQSCTVYHSYTSSLDEAIVSENKVKIDLNQDDTYKFERLYRFENDIYGLVRLNSDTYTRLSSRESKESEFKTLKYVQLYDNELDNLHLKNKTTSTLISVGVPVVVLSLLIIPILANPL